MPTGQTKIALNIDRYIQSLEAAIVETGNESARIEYLHHLSRAKELRSGVQCGASEEHLRRKLGDDLLRYQSAYLPGREVESVGRALGDLCRWP